MFSFYTPQYLYSLLVVLLFLGISILSYWLRHRSLIDYSPQKSMRDLLMPERVGIKRIIRDILLLIALACLIIAIARPQKMGSRTQDEEQKGIEIMFCIDVSNSMLSQDIAPSRISFTKTAITKLLSDMTGNKVGIVVFANNAYVQLPITTDLRTAQEFLQDVSPTMLSAQGTNIAKAIDLAKSAFSERTDIGKSIIVVTDGESHDGGAEESAQEANKKGIKVSIIGVGTERGGVIPIDGSYLKDPDTKEPVTTRLNSQMCKDIAIAGGGSYIHGTNINKVVQNVNQELNSLPRASVGKINRSGYIEYYTPWIILALLLLFIELFISQRQNKIFNREKLFSR